MTIHDDPAAWARATIKRFCDGPQNTLGGAFHESAWGEPLVGFSRGDDPIYEQYKDVVGPFHWTPQEAFAITYPDLAIEPADLTVIVWVLPQTRATRIDNRNETIYPSERWARARIFGEEVNSKLRAHVADALRAAGYPAMAPMLAPGWTTVDSERWTYASTWSERHAAYASGLGTFGLCDGLITPVGKAMRVGSVVARIGIPATPRPYDDHHAYCLYYSYNTCGKCMARCPVGAITPAGHDKVACSGHLRPTSSAYVKAHYGFDGYGCGLCQTGVPCEGGIPTPEEG